MRSVVIIGPGKVGQALAALLPRVGYDVRGLFGRAADLATAAAAEVVFITTPDRAIAGVAEAVAGRGGFRPGQVVAHTSGALSSEVLAPARQSGAATLSMHPLQTFASVETAVRVLPGSTFVLEGDPEGLSVGREVAQRLGGRAWEISPAAKSVYHAAACIASNYLVTLVDAAVRLWERTGLPREEAIPALLPLLRGTVDSVAAVGVPGALTGPVERGELEVLRGHLQGIAQQVPELLELYANLGEYTAQVAHEKGRLGDGQVQEVRSLMKEGSRWLRR